MQYAGKSSWLCECACGVQTVVSTAHLNDGHTRSCGCLKSLATKQRMTTHGLSKRPEYRAWSRMIMRCCNKNSPDYPAYGARGIKVCDQWRRDFPAFFSHIGPRPSAKYSLDRIDVNGDYQPGNVRWATTCEQAANTRRTKYLELDGQRLNLSAWAKRCGLKKSTQLKRRLEAGWTLREALTTPARRW